MSWAWWDWPLTWLTNHRPSVLWHCWLGRVTRKTVSEMTYNVSCGTLNTTIPIPSCHGVVRAMHTRRAVKTSIYVTVKPTRPEGSIMMHPPNLKSNFGVVWPWRLTSWTPNVHRFMPVTRVPTFQFAAKSVHSFSKYRLHKPVTNERTERSHCPNSVLPIQIT